MNHSNVISACYYTHQHSAYPHIAFNNLKFSLLFTRNKRKRKDDGRVVASRFVRIALSSFARLEALTLSRSVQLSILAEITSVMSSNANLALSRSIGITGHYWGNRSKDAPLPYIIQGDSKYVFVVGTLAANASRVANILEKMITYVRKIQLDYLT